MGHRSLPPLHGLRVVELARILAGPWIGQTLSDLGADVIKVESPDGDDTRSWGPPFIDRPDGRGGRENPGPHQKAGQPGEGGVGGENIQTQVVGWDPWPTAGANDWKGTAKVGQRRWQLDEAAEQKFPSFRPDLAPSNNGSASSKSPRRLNPLFVEWLMGWPIGWTSVDHNGSALRATVWYRWSRLMRGALSELGSLAE